MMKFVKYDIKIRLKNHSICEIIKCKFVKFVKTHSLTNLTHIVINISHIII